MHMFQQFVSFSKLQTHASDASYQPMNDIEWYRSKNVRRNLATSSLKRRLYTDRGLVSGILGVPLLHSVPLVSLYIGSFMAHHGMKAAGWNSKGRSQGKNGAGLILVLLWQHAITALFALVLGHTLLVYVAAVWKEHGQHGQSASWVPRPSQNKRPRQSNFLGAVRHRSRAWRSVGQCWAWHTSIQCEDMWSL